MLAAQTGAMPPKALVVQAAGDEVAQVQGGGAALDSGPDPVNGPVGIPSVWPPAVRLPGAGAAPYRVRVGW
jgi:hypothetical protein